MLQRSGTKRARQFVHVCEQCLSLREVGIAPVSCDQDDVGRNGFLGHRPERRAGYWCLVVEADDAPVGLRALLVQERAEVFAQLGLVWGRFGDSEERVERSLGRRCELEGFPTGYDSRSFEVDFGALGGMFWFRCRTLVGS